MRKSTNQNLSGIVGIWRVPDAARKCYFALHSIQHRGADGVGIAASNGKEIRTLKGLGLLNEIIKEKDLDQLKGDMACGQIQKRTDSGPDRENLQPRLVSALQGQFAVVSSGAVSNAEELRLEMMEKGLIFQGTSDAEVIAHLIQRADGTIAQRIVLACHELKGSYAFILMTKNTLYAARSADGAEPLFQARLHDGAAIASESAAFGILKAEDIEEIRPGTVVCFGKDNVFTLPLGKAKGKTCALEYVYYSRPDSVYDGKSVHSYRREAGRLLARDEKHEGDIVIGVPDTAIPAAQAFAAELKVPYEIGLIKNRYIGSTFVQPLAMQRASGMRVRLNAISSIVRGKRVFLVDDSVFEGKTARRICQLLREAGAREVHLRIASPLNIRTCLKGKPPYPQEELAAVQYSVPEMEEVFGADSVRFLDLDDFISTLPQGSCIDCLKKEESVEYE